MAHFPIIHFLAERGPRLAASKAETTALRHMESQFQAMGAETSNVTFPSFGGMEWYNALAYAMFPLATILFLESVWLALLVVTLGLILLRLDLYIWPIVNNLLAFASRSRTVTGRIHSQAQAQQTIIVTANADSRRALPFIGRYPIFDRLIPPLMLFIDFSRVVQWFLYVIALVFGAFSMREQVQMLWRASWPIAIICLLVCAAYLLQAMYGKGVPCASDNLSGLQVLTNLAAVFAQEPCQRTELIFAAVGSGRAGMLGTYFLIRALKPNREQTVFFNLSALGSGTVSMVGSEGWSRPLHASDDLTDLGYLIGSTAPLPLELISKRQHRTDCAMARSMGYRAMTLMGLTSQRPAFCVKEDEMNPMNLEHAIECVRGMIRTIDRQA